MERESSDEEVTAKRGMEDDYHYVTEQDMSYNEEDEEALVIEDNDTLEVKRMDDNAQRNKAGERSELVKKDALLRKPKVG